MKKLLWIMVLGLFLSPNVYSKEIMLSCSVTSTGYTYSIILNTSKKTIILDREKATVKAWNKYEILLNTDNSHYILDRVSGTLKLEGGSGDSHGQCKVKTKTLF